MLKKCVLPSQEYFLNVLKKKTVTFDSITVFTVFAEHKKKKT